MRRGWPVCCAFMATLSCAGLRHLEITVGPVAPHPARLLAVYPVELRFEAPAYRSFELSSDLIDAALATGRLMVVGPAEFQVLDRAHSSLYGGTDLSGKLGALRLKPSMVVGLRT